MTLQSGLQSQPLVQGTFLKISTTEYDEAQNVWAAGRIVGLWRRVHRRHQRGLGGELHRVQGFEFMAACIIKGVQ